MRCGQRLGAGIIDYTQWTAEFMHSCSLRGLMDSYGVARQLYRAVQPILDGFDALICPTTLTNAVRADQKPWTEMEVNGVRMNTDYDWVTTAHFNMLGELPVITVPIGVTADGLPVGIQVITRSFDDAKTFRVATAVEAIARNAWRLPAGSDS